MSGLRVPVFFGSILTLVVLIIQNRTPVFQLTLLGIRSQPLSLGILVTLAVVAGIFLGAILQRTSSRRSPRPRAASSASSSANSTYSSYAGPAEYQPFRSIPEPDIQSDDDQNGMGQDERGAEASQTNEKTKGWNTEASNSWTAQAEKLEEEGRFWSQPRKNKGSKGNVTPIESKRKQPEPSRDSVVDAEYRIVQPDTSRSSDGFDDNFFDDFFDEEDA